MQWRYVVIIANKGLFVASQLQVSRNNAYTPKGID